MAGGLRIASAGDAKGAYRMIMKVDDAFQACSILEGAVCAFGVFDGVHRGHRFIIEQAIEDASRRHARCVAITFSKDPDEVFRPDALKKLMSNEQRLRTLDGLGIDAVLVLPANRDFFALSPQAFMEDVFLANPPAALHVGADFRFGVHAEGDVAVLRAWGLSHGMAVRQHGLFSLDGAPVTATRIRSLLAAHDIVQANKLLGSMFALEGIVETGRGEGRNMGFRTANVTVPANLYSLGEGVYGAYAVTEAGQRCKAAVSVGGAPTFGEAAHANVEAHLLDFNDDIYGQCLRLEFAAFLRPMIVFESTAELIRTVMENIRWCREHL